MKVVLKKICEFHFDKHGALPPVLPVTVANREEMLMVSLTDVRREYKVVLVLLVHIVYTESLTGRVSEARNHVIFNDFYTFLGLVFLDSERVLLAVLYAIMIINSLIRE